LTAVHASPDVATETEPPAAPRLVAGTEPYPWPWDGDLRPGRLALVVAGADAGWINRSREAPAALERIDALATQLRGHGALVVHLQHPSPSRPDTLETPGAPGTADAPTGLAAPRIEPEDLVVAAAGIDGFFGSPLDVLLRRAGRDQLVLVGFGLEAPVHSTMRSANDAGYECLLLTDACAPLEPGCRDAALSMILMSGGIFGAIGSTPALLAALGGATADQPDPEVLP
jgi:nicotinamidase-related amidase